jgi:hypothetical protein
MWMEGSASWPDGQPMMETAMKSFLATTVVLVVGAIPFASASARDGYGYGGGYGYPGASLARPCFHGPGCRADGYPDARYFRPPAEAYGYTVYGYPDPRLSGGYEPLLTRPCFPGPGCRADGYPDARYYRRAIGGYGPGPGYGGYRPDYPDY